MPLIKCPDCNKKISDSSSVCIHCGCPIKQHKFDPLSSSFPEETTKPEKEVSIGIITIIVGLFGFVIMIGSCFDSSTSPSSNQERESYRGKFATMNSCLNRLEQEAAAPLKILTDKPNKVSGSIGDTTLVFWCEKKETGTEGIFIEGVYERYK